MVDLFGRIPVRARSYVRHIVAMRGQGRAAYSGGDNIALFGDSHQMSIFIHEVAHSLDGHAVPGKSPFNSEFLSLPPREG